MLPFQVHHLHQPGALHIYSYVQAEQMRIHRAIRHLCSRQHRFNILHAQSLKVDMCIDRSTRIVACEHDFSPVLEPFIHLRLKGMHIKHRRLDMSTIDSICKVLLINQVATGDIDKSSTLLEVREEISIDEYLTIRTCRSSDNDTIRLTDQVLQSRYECSMDLCLNFAAFSVDIIIEDPHLKRRKCLSSDGLPNIAEAYDGENMAAGVTAQGSGIEMAPRKAGWVAGCGCAPRELAEGGEDAEKSEVCNGLGAGGSRVAVDDALRVLESDYTMPTALFSTT